ncbi:MBL fold metallo-hydrolase [Parahaliea mediterranea]|uniref:MBL fold metallo-hydrolase n=1 Tax=Parahaliea mediterranea TaxID=651086 RepID=UPI000E2F9441|nr:MBL fold metallo-hydrolase [Parahaliea mediterranea]
MLFRQLFDTRSSTYTYLLADGQTGRAALIDPVLEQTDLYLQLLTELDLTLHYAIDTHIHADHVTALGRLRHETACQTVQDSHSSAQGLCLQPANGDVLTLGNLRLTWLHTPGHTRESACLYWPAGNSVFTGDALLIRGTGRTDFQQGCARQAWRSLRDQLLSLPDETLVYPGHDYRGLCCSTIGEERRFNPRLQVADEDQYAALMAGIALPRPKAMDIALPQNMHLGWPTAAQGLPA